MNKAIVLGANGFIGSHLSKALSDKGVNVIALVDGRFDYSFVKKIKGVETIEFSLSDIDKLNGNERILGADIIYNLAWEGVNAQQRNNAFVQVKNVGYGLNVLAFAKENGIKRVLIPGSAAEMSCGDGVITGNEKPAPSDLYSATKVATRYLCREYARQNDIDLMWALITSIYGPGRDDNNLLSYAIKSLLRNEKPSFSKLEQQWDYLYLDDLMDALISLGEKGKGGKVYPVGSGEHRQMVEYVRIIQKLINPDVELGIGDLPYKSDKIDNQVMDVSELYVDTGFRSKYTFEEGIKKTIDYFKSKLEL